MPSRICRKTQRPLTKLGQIAIDQVGHRFLHQRPTGRYARLRQKFSRAARCTPRCAPSSSPPHSRFIWTASQDGLCRDLRKGRRNRFAPRPAAPAWAGIWASWQHGERLRFHHQPQLCRPNGSYQISEVYLASPAVAAASAVAGYIADPGTICRKGWNQCDEQQKAKSLNTGITSIPTLSSPHDI